jgi:hypothetical protein
MPSNKATNTMMDKLSAERLVRKVNYSGVGILKTTTIVVVKAK